MTTYTMNTVGSSVVQDFSNKNIMENDNFVFNGTHANDLIHWYVPESGYYDIDSYGTSGPRTKSGRIKTRLKLNKGEKISLLIHGNGGGVRGGAGGDIYNSINKGTSGLKGGDGGKSTHFYLNGEIVCKSAGAGGDGGQGGYAHATSNIDDAPGAGGLGGDGGTVSSNGGKGSRGQYSGSTYSGGSGGDGGTVTTPASGARGVINNSLNNTDRDSKSGSPGLLALDSSDGASGGGGSGGAYHYYYSFSAGGGGGGGAGGINFINDKYKEKVVFNGTADTESIKGQVVITAISLQKDKALVMKNTKKYFYYTPTNMLGEVLSTDIARSYTENIYNFVTVSGTSSAEYEASKKIKKSFALKIKTK